MDAGAFRAARIPTRAGGRGAGRSAAGRAAAVGCTKRVVPPNPAAGSVARRTRATRVQAARRHPGEERCATCRPAPRRSWTPAPSAPTAHPHPPAAVTAPDRVRACAAGCGHPPPAAHPHPHADGRCDGPREAGAGNGTRGSGLHMARGNRSHTTTSLNRPSPRARARLPRPESRSNRTARRYPARDTT